MWKKADTDPDSHIHYETGYVWKSVFVEFDNKINRFLPCVYNSIQSVNQTLLQVNLIHTV